jgi:hypothetical protein
MTVALEVLRYLKEKKESREQSLELCLVCEREKKFSNDERLDANVDVVTIGQYSAKLSKTLTG